MDGGCRSSPGPSGMLKAPTAPWLLHGPSLGSWCGSREMEIRDMIPGMFPHPMGRDSLGRGQPGSISPSLPWVSHCKDEFKSKTQQSKW